MLQFEKKRQHSSICSDFLLGFVHANEKLSACFNHVLKRKILIRGHRTHIQRRTHLATKKNQIWCDGVLEKAR